MNSFRPWFIKVLNHKLNSKLSEANGSVNVLKVSLVFKLSTELSSQEGLRLLSAKVWPTLMSETVSAS